MPLSHQRPQYCCHATRYPIHGSPTQQVRSIEYRQRHKRRVGQDSQDKRSHLPRAPYSLDDAEVVGSQCCEEDIRTVCVAELVCDDAYDDGTEGQAVEDWKGDGKLVFDVEDGGEDCGGDCEEDKDAGERCGCESRGGRHGWCALARVLDSLACMERSSVCRFVAKVKGVVRLCQAS